MSMEVIGHALTPRLEVDLTAELRVHLCSAHVDYGLTGGTQYCVIQVLGAILGEELQFRGCDEDHV
jgi:hypothetical protein